jgi:hypothetical protein
MGHRLQPQDKSRINHIDKDTLSPRALSVEAKIFGQAPAYYFELFDNNHANSINNLIEFIVNCLACLFNFQYKPCPC